MKQVYLTFAVVLLLSQAFCAELYEGYLITLNNRILTGQIGNIFAGRISNEVLFINGFGTPYSIRAELIKGFVFRDGRQTYLFESKYEKGRCLFLRVVVKGEGMNLFQSPKEQSTVFLDTDGNLQYNTFFSQHYWVETGHNRVTRLKRLGFRKRMQRLVRDQAPELAEKIGEPGFRYPDLEKIIREFNKEISRSKFEL